MSTFRVRARGAALLIALAGVCAMATPAAAANKSYSVAITPDSVPAGQTVTFHATFTNLSSNQQLGSANLTAPDPAHFTVVRAFVGGQELGSCSGTSSSGVCGNTVQMRNLGLARGGTVIADVVVKVASDVQCGPAGSWMVAAKQSNDFNGLPGNDLTLLGTAPTASVTCGGTGIACTEGVDCSTDQVPVTNAMGSTFTLSAAANGQPDSGLLAFNQNVGATAITCKGYIKVLNSDVSVAFLPDAVTGARSKTFTLTLTRDDMQASPNNGLGQLNICFGATFKFPVKPGTPALQQQFGLNVGLLPDCPKSPPPSPSPCVSDRATIGGTDGGAVITAQAPAGGADDPRFSG